MSKARKRKTVAERRAELLAKKARLEQEQRAKQAALKKQLARLDEREKRVSRKQDAHLKIIMGAAVQAHARISGTFANELYDVFRKAVTKERDQKLVEAWFKQLADAQKEARP